MYVQDQAIVNYHYTSRLRTRGNQLCKLGINLLRMMLRL